MIRIIIRTILAILAVIALTITIAEARQKFMVLDTFAYASNAEARQVWVKAAAGQGVSVSETGSNSVLKLPCGFSPGNTRSYWDKKVDFNLSRFDCISIRTKLDDPSSLLMVSVYFQTADGGWWAAYQTASLSTNQWQDVIIPLSAFVPEGTCNGWNEIRTIRLSVNCSTRTVPTSVYVSQLKAMSSGGTANMLSNSGFEYCYSEKLPDFWGTEHWGLRKDATLVDTDAWRAKWGVDDNVSHSGRRSMRITGSADLTDSMLASMWTSLIADHTYTFSVWLRSQTPDMLVNLQIESLGSKQVQVDKKWQRFSLTGKAAGSGSYRCFISSLQDGVFWIDDVQLESGSVATKYSASINDRRLKAIRPITRPVPKVADFPVIPGPADVRVEIDKNRRFKVDGQPFIPFAMGWEGVPSPIAIQEIAKAGFNSICFTPTSGDLARLRPTLDCARENGLKVIFWFPSNLPLPEFEDWIIRLKDHPTIIAWYIYDEPSAITPELQAKYNTVKHLDPTRPAYINYVFYPKDMLGDIASRDWYPIPGNTPGFMGVATDELEGPASKSGKPSWIWLQTIGYAYYISREPWETEAECMAYSSLIHGARGIKYFAHKPHNKAMWDELRLLSREVRELTPILYSIETAPSISIKGNGVDFTTKQYQGKTYIIAVNLRSDRNKISFTIPENIGDANVLFENRKIKVKRTTLTDTFEAYQRRVYCLGE